MRTRDRRRENACLLPFSAWVSFIDYAPQTTSVDVTRHPTFAYEQTNTRSHVPYSFVYGLKKKMLKTNYPTTIRLIRISCLPTGSRIVLKICKKKKKLFRSPQRRVRFKRFLNNNYFRVLLKPVSMVFKKID